MSVEDSFSKVNKPFDLNNLIGIPPSYVYEAMGQDGGTAFEDLTIASLPIMAIYPAYPKHADQQDQKIGLQLFDLDYEVGIDKYNKILESAGVPKIDKCIYACFMNNTSITESFSVEYGESKFESIGNMASSTLAELGYITGEKDIGKMGEKVSEVMSQQGMLGKMAGVATGVAGDIGGAIQKFINTRAPGMGNIMMGHKIDFPMIWKGASYSPSYSVTIRLYNPNPLSLTSYKQFILNPIAKLVALTMPITSSESTFYFPVACSVTCPGLFKIRAGYISSLEIIKGGESNDISYTQRPGMVDVRITFNELYNTMVAEIDGYKSIDSFRPTFSSYIKQLESEAKVGNVYDSSLAQLDDEVSTVNATANSSATSTESEDIIAKRVTNNDMQLAGTLA